MKPFLLPDSFHLFLSLLLTVISLFSGDALAGELIKPLFDTNRGTVLNEMIF